MHVLFFLNFFFPTVTPVHFYKMDARPSLATKVYCYTYGNINIEIDKPEYLWVPKEKKYCTKMCSYYYHFGSCKKG